LYAAFDRFPSRKGAAIHIDRFARALFDFSGGGTLLVLGTPEMPAHQLDDDIEIVRFQRDIPNFLERALAFGRWVDRALESLDSLEICHFRDPWAGAPIASRSDRSYRIVYEVNALPSIELPSLYPSLSARTLEKIRQREMLCCAEADAIVTPSETTARLLKQLGVSAEKIGVIPNGTELAPPSPPPADAPEQYLLYFGAAQSWQGIETLFRAFARLGDFAELRLVICASQRSKAWRPYERLAVRLGISERIEWRHALPESELSAWRQHALISLAPLTDTPRNTLQGCAPLKIVEAMGSGTPVIASDLPPVRELVRDRYDGWLVHPDRPAELARAIRILIDHPELRRSLGENARRTIAERFTWERSTATLRDLYEQLVIKGGAADECLADVPLAHS
jgi:glycosyltransferase involved in cell wall biosynthesis